MNDMRFNYLFLRILIIPLLLSLLSSGYAQNNKPFTFDDVLKFRAIGNVSLSDDGLWSAYSTMPDRGNPISYVRAVLDTTEYSLDKAINPVFSGDSRWVGFTVKPDAIELENAKPNDKPKNGMAILDLKNGKTIYIDKVKSFEFSNDSKWLAYRPDEENASNKGKNGKYEKKPLGSKLILRHVISGTDIPMDNVLEYHLDSTSKYLFYTKSDIDGKSDGVYYRALEQDFCPEDTIVHEEHLHYSNLAWNIRDSVLAFLSAGINDKGEPYKCSLWFWPDSSKVLNSILTQSSVPENWYIPHKNEMKWTEDGRRIFLGLKPEWERYDEDEDEIKYTEENFFNIDTILEHRESDIWHGDDPRIKPNEKNVWPKIKDRTYQAVYHLKNQKLIQLADTSLPNVQFADNPYYTIGSNNKPYLKEITWDSWYEDLYLVDLKDGSRRKLAERISDKASVSPGGKFVAYFYDHAWRLHDTFKDTTVDLTSRLDYSFEDEEWDLPIDPPSYGIGGWAENDLGVYIYDRYDVWQFYTSKGYGYLNMTAGEGRISDITFRIVKLDKDRKFFGRRDTVLMQGFHNKEKYRHLYMHETWVMGVVQLTKEEYLHTFRAKAKNSGRYLYTKESYDHFPDLWTSTISFQAPERISNLDKQTDGYAWGNTEFVEWKNSRGDSLQGFIIKPENYDPTKRYPVLIYFYERFSDRYHKFTMPRINHRPCYPVYASDGYVIFMPDIKYITGSPGFDATDALVTGSRMLIDRGIADSNAIGIQGHSWGGYETAFIVTQTDLFKAAVAGAPVGNMTSAYSGIRRGTGLARQFQYEQYQSRIGGNLWDSLDSYLRNSPVMQAEKIETPLLIMFGDNDEAVPWEQGIELYLAMRRLGKDIVFLQYRNELHHPRKLPNQLDYAIKMKEFFDHYLRGKPARKWMTEGKAYEGK